MKRRKSSIIQFFYQPPVSKELAREWQIAKQLSRLNLLSLSNDKNHILKKSRGFYLNHNSAISKASASTSTVNQNSVISKAFGNSLISLIINIDFEYCCIPRRHCLLGQTTKQPLRNFDPQKP